MLELNKIHHGDCLDLMRDIPDKSIDMILCDLPYGTTACKWDTIIPFDALWEQYDRIIKDKGAIVLTATQPFTSALIMSNPKMFKEELVWEKHRPSNPGNARIRHMKYHESVLVFSKSGRYTYVPQMIKRQSDRIRQAHKSDYHFKRTVREDGQEVSFGTNYDRLSARKYSADVKLPSTIIRIPHIANNANEKTKHPTQKPVALFEYLIKTYTNEGETILDNCIGSGTTAVAAINTVRNFIGIEKEPEYVEIARRRVDEALAIKNEKETDNI